MAVSWKLGLDVLFVMSVTGALGYIIFVEQKEIYMYINMGLVSVLCLLYSLYFISLRKADLINWLDENRSTGGPCATYIKRELKNFLTFGLPYRTWINLNMLIGILYLPFPILMLITAATSRNVTMIVTCTVLGITSMFYTACLMQFTSDLKLRFRVKLHGGTLAIFTGMFLVSSDYGKLGHIIGSACIIAGICFYYDIWKQFLTGVNLRIDTETEPVCNGDAQSRTESPITGSERLRRFCLNITGT